MSSILGTPLSRKPVAWFWFLVAALPAVYFAWAAVAESSSWVVPAILGGIATLIFLEPRLRKPEQETVQVDENGVLRLVGSVREQIKWNEIEEISILTTDHGPFAEDVFFALGGPNNHSCLVPHDAAVRTKLLEELQARFPSLDNKIVITAMGSTRKNSFLIWKKLDGNAA